MKPAKHTAKGMTLTELCVVLAVISVVSVLVVSFATLASARSKVSVAKVHAAEDLQILQTVVENWVDQVPQNQQISVLDDGKSLTAFPSIVYLYEDALRVSFADGSQNTYRLETVADLRFDKPDTGSGGLWFCTVTCNLAPEGETPQLKTFTFTVHPRVGDVIG